MAGVSFPEPAQVAQGRLNVRRPGLVSALIQISPWQLGRSQWALRAYALRSTALKMTRATITLHQKRRETADTAEEHFSE